MIINLINILYFDFFSRFFFSIATYDKEAPRARAARAGVDEAGAAASGEARGSSPARLSLSENISVGHGARQCAGSRATGEMHAPREVASPETSPSARAHRGRGQQWQCARPCRRELPPSGPVDRL